MATIQRWKSDPHYEERVLTEVVRSGSGYELHQGASVLFIADPGFEPKAGQMARFYGRFGSTVRGVVIDSRVAYYRTEAEERQRHDEWCRQNERDDRAVFTQSRVSLDADYAALPEVFRQRLDRFRAGHPDFRWKFEAYEMSCCRDAVKIAAACQQPEIGEKLRALGIRGRDGDWEDTPAGRLDAFSAINSETNGYRYHLEADVITGLYDGHSGNSWGMAIRLAYWYLTQPENVAREHGALVPLVGCLAYGCTHPVATKAEGLEG